MLQLQRLLIIALFVFSFTGCDDEKCADQDQYRGIIMVMNQNKVIIEQIDLKLSYLPTDDQNYNFYVLEREFLIAHNAELKAEIIALKKNSDCL
jgi:hypothetical protein